VISPGADWPLVINPNLRVLDVRTLLVTDDDQRIYMTYRGLIYTPRPVRENATGALCRSSRPTRRSTSG